MHFKNTLNQTADSTNSIINSTKTRKVLSASHTLLSKVIKSRLVKHIVAGIGVGIFVGSIIPVAPMPLAIRAGAVLGTYKYLTK